MVKLNEFLQGSSPWPIITLIGCIIIWGIRQEGRINEITKDIGVLETRVDEMDRRGTRAVPLLDSRLNNIDMRVGEISRRLSNSEQQTEKQQQKIDILEERQNVVMEKIRQFNSEKGPTGPGFLSIPK